MGFYIKTPGHTSGKADLLVADHGATIIETPTNFDEAPEGKGLVCVVVNPLFEAAGYCFDEREFEAFTATSDDRPKTWLTMDKALAGSLSGYGK
jgi:hypothetical protein